MVLGGYGPTPDALALPFAWRSSGGSPAELPFPLGPFTGATTASIAIDGDRWAVTGTGVAADGVVPIVWQSTDDGLTFTPPQALNDHQRNIGASRFVNGRLRVAFGDDRESNLTATVATVADDLSLSEAPITGNKPIITDIFGVDSRIIAIGAIETDGQ